MAFDGIWAFEIAGIYGWERVSTVYLEKGRYLGGGAFMYSKGTYVTDGKKIKINLKVTQHGEIRAVFGEKRERFETEMTAKRDGNRIQGKARLIGAKSTVAQYPFRLLKLDDIPGFPK